MGLEGESGNINPTTEATPRHSDHRHPVCVLWNQMENPRLTRITELQQSLKVFV